MKNQVNRLYNFGLKLIFTVAEYSALFCVLIRS